MENPMDKREFWYIVGLVLSDISIWEHKGEINLVAKSSRKEILDIFRKVIGKYADGMYEKVEGGKLVKVPSLKIYARIRKRSPFNSIFKEILRVKKELDFSKVNSKEEALYLFLGLFDGDGSISFDTKFWNVKIRITNTNREMLEKVKKILEKFGINAIVISDGYTGKTNKPKYALKIVGTSIKEVLYFIRENSLHEERKLRASYVLKMLEAYDNKDFDEMLRLYEEMLQKAKEIAEKNRLFKVHP